MSDKNRFDLLILGKAPDPNPPPQKGYWLPFMAPEPEQNQWRIRVLSLPKVECPLELGRDYVLPMDVFNYGTFLGDMVEIEWNGQKYENAESCSHAYTPAKFARGVAACIEDLRTQHAEVSAAEVPLEHVAGRFKYASYLFDQVMGEASWRKSYPVNAGTPAEQALALQLTASIFRALKPKRFKDVARTFGGFGWSCDLLLKAAGKSTQSEQLYLANLAAQALPVFPPKRKPSDREIDSVRSMFAMAAEADRNYGSGTGERALDKVFSLGGK